jgi:hypothetical protein
MSVKKNIIAFLTMLLISVIVTIIGSYFDEKRAEDQMLKEKPIFTYNTARFPKDKTLTMKQAAEIINIAETTNMFSYVCGEKIIGTLEGENYKGKRKRFNLVNINKLNTPEKSIVGDIKTVDLKKVAEEFYYGKALTDALNDRFIYDVGGLAGRIDCFDFETISPGLESDYTIISNSIKQIVLSTTMANALRDGTDTTVTYTLKNINDKWLITDKEYSPRYEGNKNILLTSKGDNWFVVNSSICDKKQTLKPKPADFNFIFHYGVDGKNQLDTFEDVFVQDMVVEPSITTELKLSDKEMDAIYNEMMRINIQSYPSYFKPKRNVIVTPFSTYKIKVVIAGSVKNIEWKDKNLSEEKQAVQLRNLFVKIQEVIVNREEFKKLPKPSSWYE